MAQQWTVGDLVDALERVPPNYWLAFEWGHQSVCYWSSYRGAYDEIAIAPGERSYKDFDHGLVGPVLQALKKDLVEGMVFRGYKGGDYVFERERALWVANYGETSSTFITGLRVTKYDERAGLAEILTEQEGE